ncbi:MAG TPA: DNA polymerase I [Myxococcales bacterium]|nr:DNA polymerase I [Deltaproteobacteria bacterium]HAA57063.1 DNA polymerase I [Myxococcales bacterium]|tara:strand:+ start:6526 stop:9318 length:2793 start_codon:yes stop_codon:yes gene_type:complete
MAQRLFLIDGSALAYRNYYAFFKNPLKNSKGEPTSVIFGFINSLLTLLDKESPEQIAVAFDLSRSTFRTELYEDYKATRQKTPDDLRSQLPTLKRLLKAMGFVVLEREGIEADDIIGTLATRASSQDIHTMIVSGDKDFTQVVNENVQIYIPGKSGKPNTIMGIEEVKEKFGVHPDTIIDYMALVGDSSDNVPGVPKVGPKTALKLLNEYNSLDELYEKIDEVKPKGLRERLIEHKESAYLSRQLVTIKLDVEDLPPLEELVQGKQDEWLLLDLLEEVEFVSMFDKITGKKKKAKPREERNDHHIDSAETLSAFIKKAEDAGSLVIHPLIDYPALEQECYALAFALSETETYYLPLHPNQEDAKAPPPQPAQMSLLPLDPIETTTTSSSWDSKQALEQLRPLFEDAQIKKIGHDVKELYIALMDRQIRLKGIEHDTMIASYLLNPGAKHELLSMSMHWLNATKKQPVDVLGKGRKKLTWPEVPTEHIRDYLCEEASLIFSLAARLQEELESYALAPLTKELELPLIPILGDIERRGMALDVPFLDEMQKSFAEQLKEIEAKIETWSEDPSFNPNSPQQVGQLLFDKLQLHEEHDIKVKKTSKGAWSTNSETLESLKDLHELPKLIIEHRELQKLQSTYIEALPQQAVEDASGVSRVHTRLRQAGTATGRLSSFSPNLQNIPVRTPQGREIRKAFVTSRPDWTFISADYSQVELRILAHMSQDEELKRAFLEQTDIHTRTASKIFHVTPEEVTPSQRSAAKAVNFGTIYGMGPVRLAKQINVSIDEAKKFINAYFKSYPGVRTFQDKMISLAEEQGYVETILGRRRYIHEFDSEDARVRAAARHIAVNTPIQGSASDLIKKAMIQIARRLKEELLEGWMLMQIHDELLFEAPKHERDVLETLIREEMVKAIELDVPLVVDIDHGKNWEEAH